MKSRIDFPDNNGQRLRFEFARPIEMLVATRCDEVVSVIAKAEQQARAGYWVVGFVAYEAAPAFDSALKVAPPSALLPLAVFAVYEQAEELKAGEGPAPADVALAPWRMATTRQHAMETVSAIRHRIAEGDFYQVNFTTRLTTEFSGDSRTLFEALHASQPAGYSAHLIGDGWEVLSVSPELFFDWQTNGTLTTRPMKGTASDAETARAMRDSAKEQSENLMIVDLLRNDLAHIAVTGSVKVPQLFEVVELPTVWQMTSTVCGETRPDTRLVDVFRALFPCGSVTGAPKIAAMTAIAALETHPRGVYCGAIGLIRPGGHATFNVGIRTVTLENIIPRSHTPAPAGGAGSFSVKHIPHPPPSLPLEGGGARRIGCLPPLQGEGWGGDGGQWGKFHDTGRHVAMIVRAECGIGSGIVFDSRPEDEFAEWLIKCRFLHRACASFELLETLRLDNGIFWLLARHLERLGHSAEHFGFDATQAEQALTHLAERHPTGTWRVRLLLNRHGEIRTECFALEPTPEGITVAMAVTPMESDHEFLRHKTTDRRAYQGFSPPQGIFDTLLWNTQNEITEFTRGNVVVEFEGQRITPPLICGLLPGVLRAELLARGDIIERVIQKDELSKATRLWWINSLRGTILVDDVLHEALSDVPQPHGCKSGSS